MNGRETSDGSRVSNDAALPISRRMPKGRRHCGRAMPSLCILDCRVVRFIPRRAAAPDMPVIFGFRNGRLQHEFQLGVGTLLRDFVNPFGHGLALATGPRASDDDGNSKHKIPLVRFPLLTAYTCAKPPSTNNSVPVM